MSYKILAGIVLAAVVGVGVALVVGDYKKDSVVVEAENNTNNMENKNPQTAILETSLGNIKVQFYSSDAPKTVENFTKLAGEKYYDGLVFHRVIPGFMVQGGDPNCTPSRSSGSCGSGGPGYKFEDELDPNTASAKDGYKKGVLAMANAGPNTNGSQFFIMVADVPLPHSYTIFGKVLEGQDVADKISKVTTGAGDRPVDPVVIKKIEIRN
ncbi:MAG: peptidylprolyl isomerase [bacterium]|nr:peptidylprolyl isomerase [bacterium]